MIDNKLSFTKIILATVILIALGLVVYFFIPKNPSPVAVTPTVSPTITPIVTSTPEPTLTPTPVATIIPTPTPTIDISDWKTYKNDKYGFEFKYPSNWFGGGTEYDLSKLIDDNILKASGTVFQVLLGSKDQPTRFFSLNVMNKSIDEAIAYDWTSFGKRTGESVVIGGVTGEKLQGAFYGMEYVVYDRKTYFFRQTDAAEKTDWEKYDKVVSTFKFIK